MEHPYKICLFFLPQHHTLCFRKKDCSSFSTATTPAEGLPTCDMLAFTKMKCLLDSKQEKIEALEKQVQDLREDRKFLRTQIQNLTSTLSAFVRDGVTRRVHEN